MEERGSWIERHVPPSGAIVETGETVRPGMKKGNPGGAAPCGSSFEILDTAQNLDALVA